MQRMKENYERRSRSYLTRRTPIIMRLDGKAFHTYTRGLEKPFDEGLIKDMVDTTKFLCENIQGAKMGYCQSDEISLFITDYDDFSTQAWFGYEVQKMTSISASLASAKFNQLRLYRDTLGKEIHIMDKDVVEYTTKHMTTAVSIGVQNLAFFDSRVFSIPKEEVVNYFLARQKDAVKNSISMMAQSLYSHNELERKNQSDLQEMIFQKGRNWNDLNYRKKRGCTVIKVEKEFTDGEGNPFTRGKWEEIETPMVFNTEFFDTYFQELL